MRACVFGFFLVAGAIILSSPRHIPAQTPQQFDVAVIRLDPAGPAPGTSFNLFEGGRLKITNEPIKLLIRAAFQLQNAQIIGAPAWLETDRYDIEAKTGRPERIQQDQLAPLLQNLLAERFGLKSHRETRELTVYALVNQQTGSQKLKPGTEGEPSAMNTHGASGASQQLVATSVTTAQLASYIGNRLGRIVLDKTGLSGIYDFKLEWVPDDATDPSLPSLVTALREQLGLKLEQQKSPVEVLVIDSIQRPSEN
jgi:uncharacterized protein (TIGR03435 family)